MSGLKRGAWRNDGDDEIPKFGIFKADDSELRNGGELLISGITPDGTDGVYLVNKAGPVSPGGLGSYFLEHEDVHPLAYDPDEDPPEFGDTVGPVEDSVYLGTATDQPDWTVIYGDKESRGHVIGRRASGSGGVCKDKWYVWIQASDTPSSGSFSVTVTTVNDPNDPEEEPTETETSLSFDWNSTAADIAADLRNITDIGDGSDAANDRFTVVGDFPYESMQIKNTTSGGARILSISQAASNTLDNGIPHIDRLES